MLSSKADDTFIRRPLTVTMMTVNRWREQGAHAMRGKTDPTARSSPLTAPYVRTRERVGEQEIKRGPPPPRRDRKRKLEPIVDEHDLSSADLVVWSPLEMKRGPPPSEAGSGSAQAAMMLNRLGDYPVVRARDRMAAHLSAVSVLRATSQSTTSRSLPGGFRSRGKEVSLPLAKCRRCRRIGQLKIEVDSV
jgi:hypothetical protein